MKDNKKPELRQEGRNSQEVGDGVNWEMYGENRMDVEENGAEKCWDFGDTEE